MTRNGVVASVAQETLRSKFDRSPDQCTLRLMSSVKGQHPLEYVGSSRMPRWKRTEGLALLDRAYLHIWGRVRADLMATTLAQGDRQDAAAGKDYSEEFTPSEAEAIHRAMVREEQGRQSEERGE